MRHHEWIFSQSMRPDLARFISRRVHPSMTFAAFVEGASNSLAHAMCLAAAASPGGSCNPLYLYGPRGTGKTHLTHAVANRLDETGIGVCAGAFGREDTPAFPLPDGTILLLIEEIDRGLPDASALVRFFEAGGQIVTTGELPPEKLPDSPFRDLLIDKGKSADIQPPEEELRIAILKSRADAEGLSLPDDVAIFLAENIRENIASLIGALHRVAAVSSLSGKNINRFSAVEALKDYIWQGQTS